MTTSDNIQKMPLLTDCKIDIYIPQEIVDNDPERTQEIFDDVELALATCESIATNIRKKYPFLRVDVR